MDKFSSILDIAVDVLCGAWIIYSIVENRKARKSSELNECDE